MAKITVEIPLHDKINDDSSVLVAVTIACFITFMSIPLRITVNISFYKIIREYCQESLPTSEAKRKSHASPVSEQTATQVMSRCVSDTYTPVPRLQGLFEPRP